MDFHSSDQFDLITRKVKELSSLYRDAISRCDVSENEFWIWYSLIVLEEQCTQQDLCRAWSLPKQTVNHIINNLVKKEYVTLHAIPGTRNKKIICLTALGREYGSTIVQPVFETEQRVFRKLPQEDRLAFLKFLEKFTAGLRSEIAAAT